MYTEENMEYNDNYVENEEDNKGSIWTLLLRIVIIFVCLLLVIWLVSKLMSGRNSENDDKVFAKNFNDVQLASEKYFFIEKNLPEKDGESITITLQDMNNKGLVAKVFDKDGKACDTSSNASYATLTKTSAAYELKIKLTCEDERSEKTHYYAINNYECLTCTDETYMDGSLVLEDSEIEEDTETDTEVGGTSGGNTIIEDANDLEIKCNEWSDWTTIKLNDSKLQVRTRTLYKGYKVLSGKENITYGEWSDWSTTKVEASDKLEVEVKKEEKEIETWSANKTTTDYSQIKDKVANGTIKVVDTKSSSTGGYYKESTATKEVSASEYQSLNAKGQVISVLDTYYKVDCTEDCNSCYTKVYKIKYKTKTWVSGSSVTTYTYQEKELAKESVDLYRYRTISKEITEGEKIYTENWVEKLEEGYIKTEERVEYSYKDTVCKG